MQEVVVKLLEMVSRDDLPEFIEHLGDWEMDYDPGSNSGEYSCKRCGGGANRLFFKKLKIEPATLQHDDDPKKTLYDISCHICGINYSVRLMDV